MSMVERVAKALYDVEWQGHGGELEFSDSKDYWLKSARAAIEAMTGPDTRMVAAAAEAAAKTGSGDFVAVFRSMLKAALEDGS